MINGIRFKVCGLTSLVDAEFVDRIGADYMGFILYPKSPRHITLTQFAAMQKRLSSARRKVAVLVEPTRDELNAAKDAGFDFFQIHHRHDLPISTIAGWSEVAQPCKLWLAPKLPPTIDVNPELYAYAGTFLLDTFRADGFGGSGETGDWQKFSRHQTGAPKNKWVLAGGLNAANVGDALVTAGARIVDVNSGVEAAPGIKDHAKLKSFVVAIHRAMTRGTASVA